MSCKYDVGENLLFIDPVTEEEAYGRIICEYDYRHGSVAPTIIRGSKCSVYYLVELIDFISSVGSIEDLLKILLAKPPPIEYPILEGIVDIPCRQDFYEAQKINARLAELKIVLEYGPRKHFNIDLEKVITLTQEQKDEQLRLKAEINGTEGDENNEETNDENSITDGGEVSVLGGENSISVIDNDDNVSIGSTIVTKSTKTSNSRFAKKFKLDTGEKKTLPIPISSTSRTIDDALGIGPVELGGVSKKIAMKRHLNLVVVAEVDLCRPEDRGKFLAGEKFAKSKAMVQRRFIELFDRLQRKGFTMWKECMDILRANQFQYCARKIQSIVRMYLCRNVLDDIAEAWQAELRRRWQVMHAQFEHCTSTTPYCVTMNNKMYFRTILCANRYATLLRKMSLRVIRYVDRQRVGTLGLYLRRWREKSLFFSVKDVKFGHFNDECIDIVDENIYPSSKRNEEIIKKMHKKLIKKGTEAIGTDSNKYENVFSLPLIQTREKDATEIPPWLPSLGIKLKPLPVIYIPKTAQERLFMKDSKRLEYCGFRAHCEGPSDDSFWIIPGRVCLGAFPWGVANKHTTASSISFILLAGCTTFISLMEEQEEKNAEIKFKIDPVSSYLQKSVASSRFVVNNQKNEAQAIITEYDIKLKAIPKFVKSDPRWASADRDKLKCRARIKRAEDQLMRANKQMLKLPSVSDWIRLPLNTRTIISVHEMLPLIWTIEKRLADGENVYIYSLEGHGRIGLIGAILLGRLYGLTPFDALYRVQAAHDSAISEANRAVPIHCPQLPIQNQLVKDVLQQTDSVYDGTTQRTNTDPETRGETVWHLKRGTNLSDKAPVEIDQSIFAPQERLKESVYFKFDSAKDIPRLPPSEFNGRKDIEEVDIETLYDPKNIGQNRDVIRVLPIKRALPSIGTKRMPSLRSTRFEKEAGVPVNAQHGSLVNTILLATVKAKETGE